MYHSIKNMGFWLLQGANNTGDRYRIAYCVAKWLSWYEAEIAVFSEFWYAAPMLSSRTGESVSNHHQTRYAASTNGRAILLRIICHDLCLVAIDTLFNTLLGANLGLKRVDFSLATVCVRG